MREKSVKDQIKTNKAFITMICVLMCGYAIMFIMTLLKGGAISAYTSSMCAILCCSLILLEEKNKKLLKEAEKEEEE